MTYIALATALVLIVLDQLIKIIVDANMMVSQSIPVIQDVLHFTYVQNEGAAFGIFQGQRWILVGVTSVVILGGIYLLAAKCIGSLPENCAYVGDNPVRDVEGAVNAGYGAMVLFEDAGTADREGKAPTVQPDYRIRSIPELLELFPARG